MIGARHERSHRSHAARRAPNVRGERISVAKAIGGPRGMERIPDGIGAASMRRCEVAGRTPVVHDRWWRLDHGPWRIARSQRGVGAERSLLEGGQRQGHVAPGGFGSATSARMRKFSRKSPKNPFKGLYSIKERSGGVFSAKKGDFRRRRRLSSHRRSCPWMQPIAGQEAATEEGPTGRWVDSAPAQPGLRASDRST